MKLSTYISLFALLVCFSCSSTQTQEQTEEGTSTEKPQWVHYAGEGKKIVLVSGDEEYRSEEALPMLAKILNKHHGYDCTVLFAQEPDKLGTINPNHVNFIPGLEALSDADLMIIFTRFRDLPDNQMQAFEDYLASGRPVIGIRTATHAFQVEDENSKWFKYSNSFNKEGDPWDGGFGRLVLGEKWISHHGHHKHQSTRGLIAEGAADHPVTTSLKDGDLWGPTDVYGVRLPLPGDSQPLIMGQVINRPGEFDKEDKLFGMRDTDTEVATKHRDYNPNDPMMPVAWTKSYQVPGGQKGTSFAATIGSSTDMLSEGVRRMYVNAVYWLLGEDVPENANVDYIGEYNPSPYSFHDDEHFEELNLQVAEHVME